MELMIIAGRFMQISLTLISTGVFCGLIWLYIWAIISIWIKL